MERIIEYFRKPLTTGIAGLIVGLIIGLPILGWWLWPVQWTDAAPADLRPDLQVEYLCMIVDSYTQSQDSARSIIRFSEMGENGVDLLRNLTPAQCGTTIASAIDNFRMITGVAGNNPLVVSTPVSLVESIETPNPTNAAVNNSNDHSLLTLFLFLLMGTILAGAAVVYMFIIKPKRMISGNTFTKQASTPHYPEEHPDLHGAETDMPVAQFMSTYMFGDDLYDDSFSIDGPNGEFLGECGVGITETIGVGEPKKITAFEVWLFDKNDIQTVTKMLMSQHAMADKNIAQRLTAKGELIEVEPGKRVLLETATLQLEARIVDASYGTGALPPGSFFDRLTLELAIWPKEG